MPVPQSALTPAQQSDSSVRLHSLPSQSDSTTRLQQSDANVRLHSSSTLQADRTAVRPHSPTPRQPDSIIRLHRPFSRAALPRPTGQLH
eukprot:5624963-Pyramimonas_sp.AAC.1